MSGHQSSSMQDYQQDESKTEALNQSAACSAEPVMETKFNDIGIDCQEHIFKYLGLIDLLNIVDNSKEFKIAANLVFTKKFAKKSVIVEELNPIRNCSENKEVIDSIKCAKTCFQLLRNFGHLISVLKLITSNFHKNPRQKELYQIHFKRTIAYINEFCSESLSEIHVGHCTEEILKLLKPLPNVKIVELNSSGVTGLNEELLNRLFPKLNRLKYHLDQSPAVNRTSIVIIDGLNGWNNVSTRVIDLDPQLRKLCIFVRINANILRSIAQLQHLEELQIEKVITNGSRYRDETCYLEHVKKFEIIFKILINLRVLQLPEIPFSFARLETFSMVLRIESDLTQLYIFLNQNPNIIELNLRLNLTHVNLQKISSSLRSLRDFKVDSGIVEYTKNDIIKFISKMPSLKKASFTSFENENGAFEQLQRFLKNEWHIIKIDSKTVTLERLI